MVRDHAVGLDLDQGRPQPRARPRGGCLHHLPDRQQVVTVHRNARNAVGRSPRGDFGIQGGLRQGRGRGVQIVFTHKNSGRVLHTGEVERLVERRVVGRAIAEKSHPDIVGSACPRAQACADGGRQSTAYQTIGAKQTTGWVVQVHGAAAAPATAVAFAIQLGHQGVRRHALGQGMAMAAVGAGDPVGLAQMGAYPDTRRFLADVQVQEARGLALAAGDLRGQLETAQQQHLRV